MGLDKYIQDSITSIVRSEVVPVVNSILSRFVVEKSNNIEWMDKKDVSQYFKISVSQVDNLRRKGVIKGYRVGLGSKSPIRFKKKELDDAITKLNRRQNGL